MLDKLILISSLRDLLGYSDLRSVRAWCKRNKIPMVQAGKNLYVVRNFVDLCMEKDVKRYIDANYEHPDAVMDAVKEEDEAALKKQIEAPVNYDVKKEPKRNKGEKSKASLKFLKNLK